ncbi:MAG: hypothetical protein GX410_07575 [Elusimicrobia bacterium]|nr:hypothetical protein [Elusimicrobiota bacterium]
MNRLLAVLLLCAAPGRACAVENMSPPAWTAKTCYIEGDWLYCAGKALGASDEKQARALARDAAFEELRKFLRVQDLEGLDAAPHESFLQGEKGRFDAYALIRADYAAASDFSHKSSEASLEKLKELQAEQKADMDSRQAIVLEMRRDEERMSALEAESAKIRERIAAVSEKAAENICAGMTTAEVKRLLGEPSVSENIEDRLFLNYGQYWVALQSGVVACLIKTADFKGKRSSCSRKQLKVTKPFFANDGAVGARNVMPSGTRRR